MKNKVFIVIASIAALLVIFTCVALVAPENKRDEGANNGSYVVDNIGERWHELDGTLSNTAKTKATLPASSTQGIGRGVMEQKAADMATTVEYAGSAPSPVPTASIPGNTAKPIG
ncbi:MAG TPA: hypothetical protein PLK43_07845, partial [Caldisericia bacterium]|nr:hypothetical protein [Caldisericia bacterium]